ncbi:hypothetical protein [Blastococcus sp. SYSU D00813]
MVEYADFYVLIATLSPVFLFAGLVWHYRFMADKPRGGRVSRTSAVVIALVLGTVGLTCLALLWLSLMALGGMWVVDEVNRTRMLTTLLAQAAVTVALGVWDAGRGQGSSE